MSQAKKKSDFGSPLMNSIAGGITGAMEISITYPTEYTKTVMQLYPEENKKGMVRVGMDTIRQRGFFGLYRGYSSLLVFTIPKNYVRFGTYAFMKQHVITGDSKLGTFFCGLCAGAMEATWVVTPMETIKVKLIHDKFKEKPQYRNLFQGIYTIVRQEGFGGIYKGFLATLFKQSSNQAVRFVVFMDVQKKLGNYIKYKILVDLMAGAFAGFCSVMANNPIDVVKTNMQGLDAKRYNGFLDCFAQIWKGEGFKGFYKGVLPRILRVCLDVALTFSIFNSVKRGMIKYFNTWATK